ncbi:MAG: hypothetical protein IPN89_18260 [Saprospiraceae bacterium]|nr:hypothetical protein [Saprospiraceae bacterium]
MKPYLQTKTFILLLLLFLIACDSKIKDRPPTCRCEAPMVNAYVKMWADSTCSCSSHSGLFGCVLTLTCEDSIHQHNIADVYYGENLVGLM